MSRFASGLFDRVLRRARPPARPVARSSASRASGARDGSRAREAAGVQLFELECRRRPTGVQIPQGWAQRAITTPELAAAAFRAFAHGRDQESFMAVYLNARRKPIAFIEVARGALDQVAVDARAIFRYGVQVGAHSLLVGHNHPSGDAEPSDDDLRLTAAIGQLGRVFGMPLLDHLIVTDDGFYSFAARGRLPAGS